MTAWDDHYRAIARDPEIREILAVIMAPVIVRRRHRGPWHRFLIWHARRRRR